MLKGLHFLITGLVLLLGGCGTNPAVPQVRPVEGGWISSAFGSREDHPVLGLIAGRVHAGYDFAVAAGTPIRASMAGEVTFAGWDGGYGKLLVIEHAGGWTTRYGHAQELLAGPGDRVRAGDVVGLVGSTGLSTGPHLHYELRHHGTAVDPGGFLSSGELPPAPVAPVPGVVRGAPVPVSPAQLALVGEPPARPERPARTGE